MWQRKHIKRNRMRAKNKNKNKNERVWERRELSLCVSVLDFSLSTPHPFSGSASKILYEWFFWLVWSDSQSFPSPLDIYNHHYCIESRSFAMRSIAYIRNSIFCFFFIDKWGLDSRTGALWYMDILRCSLLYCVDITSGCYCCRSVSELIISSDEWVGIIMKRGKMHESRRKVGGKGC